MLRQSSAQSYGQSHITGLERTHGLDSARLCADGVGATGITPSGALVCMSLAPDFDKVQARISGSCPVGRRP